MKELARVNAKVLAAAYTCQAKQDVRYYLNGILIEPVEGGGVRCVATDGHRLIIVTDKQGSCDEPFIVEFEPSAMTKFKQKKSDTVYIVEQNDRLIAEDTGTGHITKPSIIDGRFPDYRVIVDDNLPAKSCAFAPFNGEYLRGFCDIAKILGDSHNCLSFVYGETERDRISVLFHVADPSVHARGVVMPVKCDASAMPWRE